MYIHSIIKEHMFVCAVLTCKHPTVHTLYEHSVQCSISVLHSKLDCLFIKLGISVYFVVYTLQCCFCINYDSSYP